MASFSERTGITPTRVEIQRDDMDAALRNSLWNVVYTMLETPLNGGLADAHRECRELFETLWSAFFKLPVHEISTFRSERLIATLREPFLIVWPWWKVYDFLEFLPTTFRGARHYTSDRGAQLRGYLNGALEREMSAYRFVDERLVPITDAVEIETIDQAVNATTPEPWTGYLRAALALLTERSEPDFAGSIRESTRAVEAVCRHITQDPHATMGDVFEHLNVRPSMRDAVAAFCGSTNDTLSPAGTNGNHRTPDFAEAKLTLVTCAAFVNYALQKSSTGDVSRAPGPRSAHPIR